MKRTATFLLATSLLAAPAFAAPAAVHSAGTQHPSAHAAPAVGEHEHDCRAMMDDMSATMARIQATADPNERARLMEKHMQEMHAMMATMHAQMGRMMDQMDMHGAAAHPHAAGGH